jgi:hypothetical protein
MGSHDLTITGEQKGEIISAEYRPVAETEDKEPFLHPEELLVTLTRKEAESWKHRLTAMNLQQRLADREVRLRAEWG